MKQYKTKYLATFILVFLFPIYNFSQDKKTELIIWYVGQGQMVTYSDIKTCIHFDMGGEFFPIKKLVKECGQKENKVFFSHWDWDHINFTKRAWKRLPFFCRLNTPGGKGTEKKQNFLSLIPFCKKASLQASKKLFREVVFPIDQNKDKNTTDANKYSRVVILKNKVLIPGDSPGSSEKLWFKKIKAPITILVVSHHGSRYSTTPQLLRQLPYLKLAVASARKKRYGHPHPLVKKRLGRRGVSLLSTEEFNHIHIPLE
ncbi:MAG: hydrolase [Oligoflexia bacterium]|nr:hydrolase [Oligoflexia bacterium]